MGPWIVIESYHRFKDPHISCIVAVCAEEMKGKNYNTNICWRIYSQQTEFQTLEQAESLVTTARQLNWLQNPANKKQALRSEAQVTQQPLKLPCGCMVTPDGRYATCEHWRRAKGPLGFAERILPKEFYQELRQNIPANQWFKPEVWDRMERGVVRMGDLELIASKLTKGSLIKRRVLALGTKLDSQPVFAPPIPAPRMAKASTR